MEFVKIKETRKERIEREKTEKEGQVMKNIEIKKNKKEGISIASIGTRKEYKRKKRIMKLKKPLLKVFATVTLVTGVAAPTLSVNATQAHACDCVAYYTVKSGDTLTKIAKHYHVSTKRLTDKNMSQKAFNPDKLWIGEQLIVPAEDENGKLLTDGVPLEPGEVIHLVKKGETVEMLSEMYNESVAKIKSDNPYVLKNGQPIVGRNIDIKPDGKGIKTLVKPVQPTAINKNIYVVKSGDTLYKIANTYHTTVTVIKEMNGLTSDHIYVGQELKMNSNPSVPTETAKPSSNVSTTTYKVQPGDTLSGLSSRFGVNVKDLKTLNNLKYDAIYINQTLNIPLKKNTIIKKGILTDVLKHSSLLISIDGVYYRLSVSFKSADQYKKYIGTVHTFTFTEGNALINIQ